MEISAGDSVDVFGKKLSGAYDFLRYYALVSRRGEDWY
jgi:hypothetical protein